MNKNTDNIFPVPTPNVPAIVPPPQFPAVIPKIATVPIDTSAPAPRLQIGYDRMPLKSHIQPIAQFRFTTSIRDQWGEVSGTCRYLVDQKGSPYPTKIINWKFVPLPERDGQVNQSYGKYLSLCKTALTAYKGYNYAKEARERYPEFMEDNPKVAVCIYLSVAAFGVVAEKALWCSIRSAAGPYFTPLIYVSSLVDKLPDQNKHFDQAWSMIGPDDLEALPLTETEQLKNIELYKNPWGPTQGIRLAKFEQIPLADLIAMNPENHEGYYLTKAIGLPGKAVNYFLNLIHDATLSLPSIRIPLFGFLGQAVLRSATQKLDEHHTIDHTASVATNNSPSNFLTPINSINNTISTFVGVARVDDRFTDRCQQPTTYVDEAHLQPANQSDRFHMAPYENQLRALSRGGIDPKNPPPVNTIPVKDTKNAFRDFIEKHSEGLSLQGHYVGGTGAAALSKSWQMGACTIPTFIVAIAGIAVLETIMYINAKSKQQERKDLIDDQQREILRLSKEDNKYLEKFGRSFELFSKETDAANREIMWKRTCRHYLKALRHNTRLIEYFEYLAYGKHPKMQTMQTIITDSKGDIVDYNDIPEYIEELKKRNKNGQLDPIIAYIKNIASQPYGLRTETHAPRKPIKECIDEKILPELRNIQSQLIENKSIIFNELVEKCNGQGSTLDHAAERFTSGTSDQSSFEEEIKKSKRDAEYSIKIANKFMETSTTPDEAHHLNEIIKANEVFIRALPEFVLGNIECREFNEARKQFNADYLAYEAKARELAQKYRDGLITEARYKDEDKLNKAEAKRLQEMLATILSNKHYVPVCVQNEPRGGEDKSPCIYYFEEIHQLLSEAMSDSSSQANRNIRAKAQNDKIDRYNAEYSHIFSEDILKSLEEGYQAGLITQEAFEKAATAYKKSVENLIEDTQSIKSDEFYTSTFTSIDGKAAPADVLSRREIILRNELVRIEDYASSNIIFRALVLAEEHLNSDENSNKVDYALEFKKRGDLRNLFEEIDEEWGKLKNPQRYDGYMMRKAWLAYELDMPDISKRSLELAYAVNPNFDRLHSLITMSMELNIPGQNILALIDLEKSKYSAPREVAMLKYFEGVIKQDKNHLYEAISLIKAGGVTDKKACIEMLTNSKKIIDTIDYDKCRVARHLAIPDEDNTKTLDLSFTILSERLGYQTELKNKLSEEQIPALKAAWQEDFDKGKIELENHIDETLKRLCSERSINDLRNIHLCHYAHLSFDIIAGLFGEKIAKRFGAEDPSLEVGFLKTVGMNVFGAIEHRANLNMIAISNKLPDEVIQSLGAITPEETEFVNNKISLNAAEADNQKTYLSNFFTRFGYSIFSFKLFVAVSDYLFKKSYMLSPKDTNGDRQPYGQWVKERQALANIVYVGGKVANALTTAQITNTMITLIKAGVSMTSVPRIMNMLISIPHLSEMVMGTLEDDKEATNNWYRLFFGCFIENMSAGVGGFVRMHNDTMLNSLADFLHRRTYFSQAGYIIDVVNYPIIFDIIMGISSVQNIFKTLTISLPQKLAERQIHNLWVEMNSMINDLITNCPSDANQYDMQMGKAISVFRKVKEALESFVHSHADCQRLYVTSLYNEHSFAGDFEYKTVIRDGNGFFSSVSCYTTENPQELRALAASYIKTHRDFFQNFLTAPEGETYEDTYIRYINSIEQPGNPVDELVIRALSIKLARPIIILFNSEPLDLWRQGLGFGDVILSGAPIFVNYDTSNELYNSVLMHREMYFEEVWQKKLHQHKNNELPADLTIFNPEHVSDFEKQIEYICASISHGKKSQSAHNLQDDVLQSTMASADARLKQMKLRFFGNAVLSNGSDTAGFSESACNNTSQNAIN